MYAVFVIAAILLSVSPMHARTLLAALPASAPNHQFASDDQDSDQNRQAQRLHLPSVRRTQISAARPEYSFHFTQTTAPSPATRIAPAAPAAGSGQLEHSPHAP